MPTKMMSFRMSDTSMICLDHLKEFNPGMSQADILQQSLIIACLISGEFKQENKAFHLNDPHDINFIRQMVSYLLTI